MMNQARGIKSSVSLGAIGGVHGRQTFTNKQKFKHLTDPTDYV